MNASLDERFLDAYDKRYRNKTTPYDEVCELLDNLNKMGVALAVNSNKRNDYTQTLINDFFPYIPFVAVFGQRESIPRKPDPTSALEIANLMALPADSVLYIGDTPTDVLTGKNAGMNTIGVTWGFRRRTELEENESDFIVERPSEIMKIIMDKT